jgi:hypothetical protein
LSRAAKTILALAAAAAAVVINACSRLHERCSRSIPRAPVGAGALKVLLLVEAACQSSAVGPVFEYIFQVGEASAAAFALHPAV